MICFRFEIVKSSGVAVVSHPKFFSMKMLFFFSLFFLVFLAEAEAIDISALGGWTETINAADLTSGAGSDLTPTYTSAANATATAITNCINNNDWWRVDVRRSDANWHVNFTLRVRRTSAGTGGGAISGGTTFLNVPTTDTQFFSGRGDRSNISSQYRLTGMSINVDPGTYSTTVIYTVVDL